MAGFAGTEEADSFTPFKVTGNFIALSLESIGIGLVFGLIPTLMTKHCRFHSHSAIVESSLLMCFAMMSYFLADMFEKSGIVALLACTMIMSHYSWYNLSP